MRWGENKEIFLYSISDSSISSYVSLLQNYHLHVSLDLIIGCCVKEDIHCPQWWMLHQRHWKCMKMMNSNIYLPRLSSSGLNVICFTYSLLYLWYLSVSEFRLSSSIAAEVENICGRATRRLLFSSEGCLQCTPSLSSWVSSWKPGDKRIKTTQEALYISTIMTIWNFTRYLLP